MRKFKSYLINAKRKLNSVLLTGDKYLCPLCDKSFRRFLSYGANPSRENVCCPYCGSLERHRLLWVILQKMWESNELNSSGNLLHVAPEPVFQKKFTNMFDYISIDLDGANAMMAMDITSLDFDDEKFDVVICNHVLEHVPDDMAALSELYRVMKPGSWGSIQVPIKGSVTDEDLSVVDPREREIRYGQSDHVRQYGSDFVARLERVGFKVIEIDNNDFLSEDELKKIGVAPDEYVVLVKKV